MKKIYVREFNVPIDAMLEVAPLLHENEIIEITGSDEDDEIITIEVHYDQKKRRLFTRSLTLLIPTMKGQMMMKKMINS